MNSITESPVRLSDILGSSQIGDLTTITGELGTSGEFPLGTIMCLDANGRLVGADGTNNDGLYGILLEDRIIMDIVSERNKTVPIARHGTFKANMLTLAAGAEITSDMASRLRNLGIYLEGLAERLAPPFRIRTLVPNFALPDTANVAVTVNCDGSVPNNALIMLDNVAVAPPATWIDHATVRFVITDTGTLDPRIIRVKIRIPGTAPVDSNELMFQVSSR